MWNNCYSWMRNYLISSKKKATSRRLVCQATLALIRCSAICLCSELSPVRAFSSKCSLSLALGLRVWENVSCKTKVWPHSTSEQAQYRSASSWCLRLLLRITAAASQTGQNTFILRMLFFHKAVNSRNFTLFCLIFHLNLRHLL